MCYYCMYPAGSICILFENVWYEIHVIIEERKYMWIMSMSKSNIYIHQKQTCSSPYTIQTYIYEQA